MNKHALVPLIVGLVVGVAALKLGYDHILKMKKQTGPEQGPVQKVVVANTNIPLSTKLTDKDVMLVSMPVALVPEGVFTDLKDVVGQTLRVSLNAKLPLLKSMVGPGQGLEGVIPPGYRAVAVKVDEFISVGGLLRPGVRVDVLATLNVQRKSANGTETVSKVVLQNIEVRAVGQQIKPDDSGVTAASKMPLSQSVTLLLKSDQAEILNLAATTGSIRLALRSAADDRPETTKGITLSQLVPLDGLSLVGGSNAGTFPSLLSMFGKKKPAVRPVETKTNDPYVVEIVSGDHREQICFASADSDRRVEPKHENKKEEPAAPRTGLAPIQAEAE